MPLSSSEALLNVAPPLFHHITVAVSSSRNVIEPPLSLSMFRTSAITVTTRRYLAVVVTARCSPIVVEHPSALFRPTFAKGWGTAGRTVLLWRSSSDAGPPLSPSPPRGLECCGTVNSPLCHRNLSYVIEAPSSHRVASAAGIHNVVRVL